MWYTVTAAIVHAKNWTWNSSRKKKNHTKSFQGTQWRTPHPAAGRQGGAFPAAAPKPGQPRTPFLCWPEGLDQGPGAADTWACQLFAGCEEQDQLALKQVCVALLWSHKVPMLREKLVNLSTTAFKRFHPGVWQAVLFVYWVLCVTTPYFIHPGDCSPFNTKH